MLSTVCLNANQTPSLTNNIYSVADDDGPIFDLTPMTPFDRSYDLDGDSVSVSVNLKVDVSDEDLPHTVLAEYKNVSATSWTEVRLRTEQILDAYTFRMSVHLFDYVLDVDNTFAAWDIRIFANDSSGNWAQSDEFRISISASNNISDDVLELISFWLRIAAISIAAIVVISFPVLLMKRLN